MTDQTRDELRTQLANALSEYQDHTDHAHLLLERAELCGCEGHGVGCTTHHDDESPERDADRAAAAVYAQLATAAAGVAQAMATLLAPRA